MPHYRYTRDLDGAPTGTVRSLDVGEAAPLLKSGAVVETVDAITSQDTPAAATADLTITGANVGGTKESVAAPKATRAARAAH